MIKNHKLENETEKITVGSFGYTHAYKVDDLSDTEELHEVVFKTI